MKTVIILIIIICLAYIFNPAPDKPKTGPRGNGRKYAVMIGDDTVRTFNSMIEAKAWLIQEMKANNLESPEVRDDIKRYGTLAHFAGLYRIESV